MADKNLWVTFEKTGSVADYLSYKGIQMNTDKSKVGESAVESVDKSDRDDTVRSSYR